MDDAGIGEGVCGDTADGHAPVVRWVIESGTIGDCDGSPVRTSVCVFQPVPEPGQDSLVAPGRIQPVLPAPGAGLFWIGPNVFDGIDASGDHRNGIGDDPGGDRLEIGQQTAAMDPEKSRLLINNY